jgi:hypothetical protein
MQRAFLRFRCCLWRAFHQQQSLLFRSTLYPAAKHCQQCKNFRLFVGALLADRGRKRSGCSPQQCVECCGTEYLSCGRSRFVTTPRAAPVPNGTKSLLGCAATFCSSTPHLLFASRQLNRNYPHWQLPLR